MQAGDHVGGLVLDNAAPDGLPLALLRAALAGGILVDLMKTHPKPILGGTVLENPHCLTADEVLASRA